MDLQNPGSSLTFPGRGEREFCAVSSSSFSFKFLIGAQEVKATIVASTESAGGLAAREALTQYGERVAELNAHLKDQGERTEHLKEVLGCVVHFQAEIKCLSTDQMTATPPSPPRHPRTSVRVIQDGWGWASLFESRGWAPGAPGP